MIIDQKKQDAINMLVQGGMKKTDIAKKLGIGRTTLYDWLDNPDFVAALDKAERQLKEFGKKQVTAKLDAAIDKLWDLAETTDNQMVKAKVLQFFVDQAIGKASSKMEITAETVQQKVIDTDELEKELNELEEHEDKEEASSDLK